VALLDERGTLLQAGRIAGRPAHAAVVPTPAGPLAVLATDKGEVKGFRVGD